MIRILLPLIAALPLAPASAQLPTAGTPTPEAAPQEPAAARPELPIVVETRYDAHRSWALFAACDANADDRLSLFEVRRALVDLGGAANIEGFRRLDVDADGFIEWPEFDARLRLAIEQAGSIRLRPARPVQEIRDPSAPVRDGDPVQLLITALDRDADERLDIEEFTELLRVSDVDPALAQGFVALDADRSGELDENELGPALQFLPGAWKLMPGEGNPQANLPIEFRPVDRNLDGVIDVSEIETALRRTHPTLVRWAPRVLRDADRTGNGKLGAAEIRAAQQ